MRGFPFKRQPLGAIKNLVQYQGQRQQTKISGDSFTYWFLLTLTLTFTIAAGPATAVRGNGTPWQAIDSVGLSENGVDVANVDPRVLYYIGQTMATSATIDQRASATNLANGTYTLVSSCPIPLSDWNMVDPGETAYRELDPKGETYVWATLSNNAATRLFNLGAATCTFNNSSNIQVTQFHNPNQRKLPLFRPYLRQATKPIVGADTLFTISLPSARWLGAVYHMMDDTNIGALYDTVSSAALRSDLRDYVGPTQASLAQWLSYDQLQGGGDLSTGLGVAGLQSPFFGFNFRFHGQLSQMPQPNEINLRSEMTVALSGNGASTAPVVRTTWWEYERPTAAVQGPNGQPRIVVAPSLPANWG
jgi:hypothetical protein